MHCSYDQNLSIHVLRHNVVRHFEWYKYYQQKTRDNKSLDVPHAVAQLSVTKQFLYDYRTDSNLESAVQCKIIGEGFLHTEHVKINETWIVLPELYEFLNWCFDIVLL